MQTLKAQRIWGCWIFTVVKEKKIKKPISVHGGETGADEAHSCTWGTYEEAVEAKEKYGYDGIFFVVLKGYFFLDIDHRNLNDPYVKVLLERFPTYSEMSISGNGIHIYGLCDMSRIPSYTDAKGRLKLQRDFYTKHPVKQIELYIGGLTNRLAVFTGNAVNDVMLTDCTDAILTTLDKDMRRKPKIQYSEKRDGDDKRIFDLITALRKQKNGGKFSKLFDSGDISDYGSQSEADLALCAIIAFRTGNNPELIDEIFRQSALYRPKWDRDDYKESTIEKGIEACHGTFHKSVMPKPYFVKYSDRTGELYVDSVQLAKYFRENTRYILVRDNGKQGVLKYVYENGVYRLYAEDMLKAVLKQYIVDYDEGLLKMSKVNEAYQIIITDLNYISQDELNADETIINFTNGLLKITATDLRLLPHSPDVYSTIQIPCEWTGIPKPTPIFNDYIGRLSDWDEGKINLSFEVIGVVISNIKCWRFKKSIFMVGKGDTGKSVLKSLIEWLIGKGNYIGIDLKEIESRFGTGAIYGTRLAGSSDMSFMSVDELKTFKKITGGDSLFAEFKGQQAFEYVYNGFLMFCMNRLPKFGGDDGKWVYDRILVFECPNVIPKNEQDKQLLEKLYEEREGIVYQAVEALQKVIAGGYRFTEPESVKTAGETYKHENSTVVAFFKECMCPVDEEKFSYHCTTGRIYKVYQGWCRENNNGFSKTAKEFREALSEHLSSTYGEMTIRRNGNTYYRDFTLNSEAKEQYAKEYGYDATEFL